MALPAIAFCLALNASASPPAKLPLPILLGVTLPESVPLLGRSESLPRLTALSLAGVGGGKGFLAIAAGLLTGGAGGVGLARTTGPGDGFRSVPFVSGVAASAGVGRAGATGGGGGGGGGARSCSISSTYADGAQPWEPVLIFLQSHHPGSLSVSFTGPWSAASYRCLPFARYQGCRLLIYQARWSLEN